MKGIGRKLALVAGAAAVSLGLAACGSSSSSSSDTSGSNTSAGDGTLTLRIGYVTTKQHPYGIAIDKFAEEVKTASGGKIVVNPLPGASQGNDVTLLDDVSGGTIELAGVSTAVWDSKGVNVFQPLQAPFLITSYPLSEKVLGGEIGQAMLDDANGPAKLGLVGLGILEGGLRKPVGAKAALKSVADFKGKKIRAPASKVMTSALKALGAEPVSMPLGDVAPALKNGTVDGMEANYGLIVTQKFNESAQYVTADVTLWPFPAAVVVNKKVWDGLSSDQQKVLTDAGKNLAKNSIEGVFINPPPTATNFVKTLCDAGMVFAAAGDANRTALAAAAKPALDELAANSETGDYLKQIQDLKTSLGPPAAAPPLPAGCKTS